MMNPSEPISAKANSASAEYDAQLADAVPHSPLYQSWRRLRRNRLAFGGLILVVFFIVVALFAPVLSPMNPNAQIYEYEIKPPLFKGNLILKKIDASEGDPFKAIPIRSYAQQGDTLFITDFEGREEKIPTSELFGTKESDWHKTPIYLMGTDKYGRDVCSRIIYGTRVSLAVGVIATSISLLIGLTLGAVAGYFRGKVDAIVMWVMNVVWSFPELLLVIAISVALGRGFWQVFLAVGLASWVDTARIVRGQFFSLREREFVEATKALGFSAARTIFKHILPNTVGPVTVVATAGFATAIIAEASLSFLGFGVQPPTASWGSMLRDGYAYIVSGNGWWLTVFPGLAIMLAVLAINLLGDGLRDAFDTRLK
ncbi:MAG: ABC transporter permease [Chloroherpetonaceae bacterium]